MATNSAGNRPTAASGTVLQGQGAGVAPAFSTCTYPSTAGTSGNLLVSDGTNWNSTAGIITVTGTLTNSQIKALHGTPVSAISAPGAGKAIRVIQATIRLSYGGNNAFTASASQTIGLYWNGVTAAITAVMANSSITATANNFSYAVPAASNGASTLYENVAMEWFNPVSTEISGNAAANNTMPWSISYIIV